MVLKKYYNSELLFDTGIISEKPLFSICLSTYNFESSILQALRTLVCQTYSDYEIVIHDDSSTDNTCQIIIDYLNSLNSYTAKRIRLYRSFENGGIMANRLRAFAHSDGIWLIQTDGDDFSPLNRLEDTKKILESLDYEPMLLSTNSWRWVEGTPYDEVPLKAIKGTSPTIGWVKLVDIVDQPNLPNGSSGFIIHRKVFDVFYGSIPQVRIIADDPVLAKRALLIGDAYISDKPVYYCRISNRSASGSGVAGKKWIIDRYNRWNLLLQDIAHIRQDHKVPVQIQKGIDKWKERMLLDAKLIDCSVFIWPYYWIKMIFISPWEAKQALKKRIKLILLGSVNASIRKQN